MVDSWGNGLPDNTQAIAGYDSISGVYRRVLVDETGKIQADIIASVTVDPASLSGLRVKQNPAEVSGQFVTAALTSGGYVNALANVISGGFVTANVASGSVVRILDSSGMSGQFVNSALTSGGYVNALANVVSGGFVTANVASGSVVRILDPSGISGLWVRQDPATLSGQFVKMQELLKSTGLSSRAIVVTAASGGTLIAAAETNRKSLKLQFTDATMQINGGALQSGQGLSLNGTDTSFASTSYGGELYAIAQSDGSGHVVIVTTEA